MRAQPPASSMKKYVGWRSFQAFHNDCAHVRQTDILVSPGTAGAVLGYSKVSMRRIIDQGHVSAWAWYEGEQFHPSEIVVSVHSLLVYGLRKGRIGKYEKEEALQALLEKSVYEQLQREIQHETE